MLRFEVDAGVFAASGLDPGTALLIENLVLARTDRVLDLGCGWGPIGIAAAKSAPEGYVILTDVNRRATRLANANLKLNAVSNAEVRVGEFFEPVASERFNVIASNLPYHIGRPAILRLLAQAPEHLVPDGRLVIVGKGSQGIRYYQAWLEDHWSPQVEVLARGGGYRVLLAKAQPTELGQ
jgi:16S rRNA (guanine1207-N2)-methyltransferase